jgi:hypothetical protein
MLDDQKFKFVCDACGSLTIRVVWSQSGHPRRQ